MTEETNYLIHALELTWHVIVAIIGLAIYVSKRMSSMYTSIELLKVRIDEAKQRYTKIDDHLKTIFEMLTEVREDVARLRGKSDN